MHLIEYIIAIHHVIKYQIRVEVVLFKNEFQFINSFVTLRLHSGQTIFIPTIFTSTYQDYLLFVVDDRTFQNRSCRPIIKLSAKK